MLRFVLLDCVWPFSAAVLISLVLGRVARREGFERGYKDGGRDVIVRLAPLLAAAGVPVVDVERALKMTDAALGRSEAKPN